MATADAACKKVKLNNDFAVMWGRVLFGLPVVILLIPFTTISYNTTFWIVTLVLLPLDILMFFLYIKAIRISPLSLTIPFLSLTPLFLVITSFLFLGELPSKYGFFGILLIMVGGYVLHAHKAKDGLFHPIKSIFEEKGTILMIAAAFLASLTANLLKIAILHSNPNFTFVVHVFLFVIILTILFYRPIKTNYKKIIENRKWFFISGVAEAIMFFFHILAAPLVIVPYMISIKRSSIVFSILYGHYFFKEEYIRQRLIGAGIMMSGAALILIFQ